MAKSSKKAKLNTESLRPLVELLRRLRNVESSYIRRRILYTAGFPGNQAQQLSTLDVQHIINTIENIEVFRRTRAPQIRELILRQIGLSQGLTNRLIQIVNHEYYHNNHQPQLEQNNNNDEHNL